MGFPSAHRKVVKLFGASLGIAEHSDVSQKRNRQVHLVIGKSPQLLVDQRCSHAVVAHHQLALSGLDNHSERALVHRLQIVGLRAGALPDPVQFIATHHIPKRWINRRAEVRVVQPIHVWPETKACLGNFKRLVQAFVNPTNLPRDRQAEFDRIVIFLLLDQLLDLVFASLQALCKLPFDLHIRIVPKYLLELQYLTNML